MSHKKILMCNPKNFEIKYDINPWMQNIDKVDNKLADTQWNSLLKLYQKLNIKVEQIKAEPDLPDMVFTANAGLVYKNMFFPSNFRFKERKPERARFVDWFEKSSYKVIDIPQSIIFEGAGDALFCGKKLYIGHGFRSMRTVINFLKNFITDFEIISLGLSNPYFYHLDTCFSPLPNGKFIYYPDAFDDQSRILLKEHGGYAVTEEFCVNYGCNLVTINKKIITSFSDWRLEEISNKEGLRIEVTNMSEFLKSGGGVRCLTLFI